MNALASAPMYERRFIFTNHAVERFAERTREEMRFRGITELGHIGDVLDRLVVQAVSEGRVEYIYDKAVPGVVVDISTKSTGRLYCLFKQLDSGDWGAITTLSGDLYDKSFRIAAWRRLPDPPASAVAIFGPGVPCLPAEAIAPRFRPAPAPSSPREDSAKKEPAPAEEPVSYLLTWSDADGNLRGEDAPSKDVVVKKVERLVEEGHEKSVRLYAELPLQVKKRVDVIF